MANSFCFNPRSPCGERRITGNVPHNRTVSPHAPLAGSDMISFIVRLSNILFQPTLPLRGATTTPTWLSRASSFNPRSPCGERLRQPSRVQVDNGFQPTLPLRGATYGARVGARPPWFQPTLPLRGATMTAQRAIAWVMFQPTLLAGSDHLPMFGHLNVPCFSPRSPCGERRAVLHICYEIIVSTRSPCGERRSFIVRLSNILFQPTLPLRGATSLGRKPFLSRWFQPTLPLRGSDVVNFDNVNIDGRFNPRSLRGATSRHITVSRKSEFQPTLPLRGATVRLSDRTSVNDVSTHAPLRGATKAESVTN